MKARYGVVAAGHPKTAEAAALILEAGGNAFDAVLAALTTACVAEPALASLGGGGFLLARTQDGHTSLYDFFVQTPCTTRLPEELDFFPILANFGPVQQEFHIGKASIATPGVIKGIFTIHETLGSMPLSQIIAPAASLARNGVEVNALQSHIFDIIAPIFRTSEEAWRQFASKQSTDSLARPGDVIIQHNLADTLETLVCEGDALFYQGEMGNALVKACREQGGLLTAADLQHYQVVQRRPLSYEHAGAIMFTNPPPSCGGLLIAFGLALLQSIEIHRETFGSTSHLTYLTEVMALTQLARQQQMTEHRSTEELASALLASEPLEYYRQAIRQQVRSLRGTTHISLADCQGNVASLTISNGEGSGFVIPETGIMVNNMLGEADLHPHGFHRTQADQRIVSMMSPTILLQENGQLTCTGSGGSNRIRTAILQVLANILEFNMSIEQAVCRPRIHFEDAFLNVEGGFTTDALAPLRSRYPSHKFWPGTHLFFGGAHTVMLNLANGDSNGIGDPRRGGVSISV